MSKTPEETIDNGGGFPPEKTKVEKGKPVDGMTALRDRLHAERVNGSVGISAPVPVEEKES